MKNPLDHIFAAATRPQDFAVAYLDHLDDVMRRIDVLAIERFVEVLLAARKQGSRIFFLGNGGSAATSDHFANDIGIGTRSWQRPFRAVSLASNAAVMTAIANDDGYESIFIQQLQVQMQEADVVVAISASGNSVNALRAVEYAHAHGAVTVGLTGFDGGRLRQRVQVSVHVPTDNGEYGPVEDAHMILDHLVGAYLIRMVHAEAAAGGATP